MRARVCAGNALLSSDAKTAYGEVVALDMLRFAVLIVPYNDSQGLCATCLGCVYFHVGQVGA